MRSLLVVSVLCAALCGCSGASSHTPTPTAPPHVTDAIYSNDFPASERIGASETVLVGRPADKDLPRLKITLKAFTDPVTGATPPAPSGQRYVSADMVMQNLDNALSASVDATRELGLSVGGADLVRYQTGVTIAGEPAMPATPLTIAPGTTVEGWVTFLIAANARTSRLIYNASLSGAEAVWVVLPAAP